MNRMVLEWVEQVKIIFFLSSVIRNRLLQIKCTFEAFIHMKKAFDSINSNLSYYKLLLNSIMNGCYYILCKNFYDNTLSAVLVKSELSDLFVTESVVRQGDKLQPTSFSLILNYLKIELKNKNFGD